MTNLMIAQRQQSETMNACRAAMASSVAEGLQAIDRFGPRRSAPSHLNAPRLDGLAFGAGLCEDRKKRVTEEPVALDGPASLAWEGGSCRKNRAASEAGLRGLV
jgi:hypothetical protein